MVGMVLISAGIVFFAIMALKLIPAYIEFATIQGHLRELARAPDTRGASPSEIMAAFNRRAQVDDISSVNGRDLDISLDGSEVILSAVYSTRIKMVGNLSACIDFEASSE